MTKAKRRGRRRSTKFTTQARIIAHLGGQSILQAPEVYRVTLPYTFLNKNSGMNAGWLSQDRILAMLAAEDQHVKLRNAYDVYGYDIVVLRRWLSPKEGMGELVREDIKALSKELTGREAVIVYESDDDYSGRYRPADVTSHTWKTVITAVDAVIASTEPLGKLMAEEAGLEKYYVAKNAIHYEFFTETSAQAKREDGDKIVVMLAGTATHDQDWMPVAEAMPRIMKDYSNVAFKVAGNVPDYLYGKCEFVPPVHYSQYPAVLRQADILCCSLDPDDQFNDSKSCIKIVEGWCAVRPMGKHSRGGCAIIASQATPYKGVVTHRNTGLMVDHTPEAWEEAIRLLIEDRHLRQKIQVNGLKQARGYDIALRWRDWYRVFDEILANRGQERRSI